MSSSQDLVAALKAELRRAGITYAVLARELGLAESSVKRILARGDLTLARIDQILAVLKMDFAELAARVAQARPAPRMLTLDQERAVVADPKLLLMALSVTSRWSYEQIVASYRISEPEAVAYMIVLDRLGIIELGPHNRYRLKVDKTFRWRPDGPVMAYFRERVVHDYFAGSFAEEGETLMLVHGEIAPAAATAFVERLQRLAQEFARQHVADQPLPAATKRPYTMLVGLRSWLFAAVRDLKRPPA